MAIVEPDEHTEPTAEEPPTVPPAVGSFFMSVTFWFTLVIAAMMYAAVSLSPKLADWVSVREQHAANAVRLQEMEDEADYLERVAAALKNDPEFAHRLVHATQSGNIQHEFVPVGDKQAFGGTSTVLTPQKPLVQPAVAHVVFHLASHHQHRTWLLFGAAGLTILAFTLLNDSGTGFVQAAFLSLHRVSNSAVARYSRDLPEPPADAVEIDDE